MSARKVGKSARSSAEWIRLSSRSRWKFWKVLTEFWRSAKISFLTCLWTLRRTSRRLVQVSPAEISSIESRNLVCNLSLDMPALPGQLSTHELVTHPVNRSEMYWIRRIPFQLLAQFQNMIIHGASRRVILIDPNLVQQLIASYYAVCILDHELESLEFLRGQPD